MAEQVSGLNLGPIEYPLGLGWYDYQNLLAQLLAQSQATQATTGKGVLDTLTQFLTSPTSGPLGLAALAAYGSPQGVAQATQGRGFDTSQMTSRFESLLDTLMDYTRNLGRKTSEVPFVDPYKAPALSPENAAKAPNVAQEWIKAWEAYHPGQLHPQRSQFGLQQGGYVPMTTPTPTPTPTPIPTPTPTPAVSAQRTTPATETVPPIGLMQLAQGARKWVEAGGSEADYWTQIRRLGNLIETTREALRSELLKYGKLPQKTKQAEQVARMLNIGADTPEFRKLLNDLIQAKKQTSVSNIDYASFVSDLINRYQPWNRPRVGYWTFMPSPTWQGRFQKGGGVTLAGRPHWIVDDNGYPVAVITEDGQPEHIRGKGVEVVPLKPDRYEAYTGKRPGEEWARMLAKMQVHMSSMLNNRMPHAATGSKFLFPKDVPGSKVDTSPLPGTNMIPTWGGPAEPLPIGQVYGAASRPKSIEDLMRMVQQAPGSTYQERYARLLGGVLSGNQTMREAARALNEGRVPGTLPTSQQWSTMSPFERSALTSLLMQTGIISSPEDLLHYIRQFRPDSLS
jgi:hypothetical protein